MSEIQQKPFREAHTIDERKAESTKILTKYDDRVPVIVERAPRSSNVPDIDKKKFLVPGDLTLARFLYVIRKRINFTAEQALYVFVECENGGKKSSIMPVNSESLSVIYQKYKDEDGFLYITYCGEKTFG